MMSTYTHAASSSRSYLRAYLVGVGATAALTAGALVAFLSLATFVAFNGLPFGGSSDDVGAAYLDSGTSAAPTAAGAALGTAPGAVARDPVRGSRGSAVKASSGSGGSRSGGSGGGDPSGKGPSGSGGGPTEPGGTPAPGNIPPPPVDVPPLPSTSGPVTRAVQGVDGAAGTNLSGPTRGVTRAVDGAVSAPPRRRCRGSLGRRWPGRRGRGRCAPRRRAGGQPARRLANRLRVHGAGRERRRPNALTVPGVINLTIGVAPAGNSPELARGCR